MSISKKRKIAWAVFFVLLGKVLPSPEFG